MLDKILNELIPKQAEEIKKSRSRRNTDNDSR